MPPTSKNIKNILNNCTNNNHLLEKDTVRGEFYALQMKRNKIRSRIAHTHTHPKKKMIETQVCE